MILYQVPFVLGGVFCLRTRMLVWLLFRGHLLYMLDFFQAPRVFLELIGNIPTRIQKVPASNVHTLWPLNDILFLGSSRLDCQTIYGAG